MARERKSRRKIPKQIESPNSAKVPQVRENPDTVSRMKPVWRIGQFDLDGPWGKDVVELNTAWDNIYSKLKSYESMTWGDIDKNRKRDHTVLVEELIPVARKRLQDLKIEQDELFRFRFSSRQRLWGIRSLNEFTILWWDPNHEICPSTKRHT